MCKYCDDNEDERINLPTTNGESSIQSDGDEHCIYFELFYYESFLEINYCPMCGRKLDKGV